MDRHDSFNFIPGVHVILFLYGDIVMPNFSIVISRSVHLSFIDVKETQTFLL